MFWRGRYFVETIQDAKSGGIYHLSGPSNLGLSHAEERLKHWCPHLDEHFACQGRKNSPQCLPLSPQWLETQFEESLAVAGVLDQGQAPASPWVPMDLKAEIRTLNSVEVEQWGDVRLQALPESAGTWAEFKDVDFGLNHWNSTSVLLQLHAFLDLFPYALITARVIWWTAQRFSLH